MSLAVAYGAASFGASAMQSLFITYYVMLYVSVYELPSSWFFVGELCFLVWNSLNDPLFGYLLRDFNVSNRLAALNGGGALWVASFALFFLVPVSWQSGWAVGVHFVVALLLYDTFLSYVLLVHASLLADVTTDPQERASCVSWSAAFSIAGSCSVFVANMLWNRLNVLPFRIFCLFAALASLLSLQLSYILLRRLRKPNMEQAPPSHRPSSDDSAASVSIWEFWDALKNHPNFWVFALINLVQVFNCHWNSNFLALSLNSLLAKEWSVSAISVLLSLTAILPHVVVVLLAPLLKRIGVSSLLYALSVLKVLIGVTAFALLSPAVSSALNLAIFFLANKVFTESMCRHGNLVMTDLIDEDAAAQASSQRRSSLYFGAIALLTKPGQALAAMVGWALALAQDKSGLFKYVTLIPAICGVFQATLWHLYTSPNSKEDEKIV